MALTLTKTPEVVFADTRAGVPHRPLKAEVRTLLREIVDQVPAAVGGGGGGGGAVTVSEYSVREALGYLPARAASEYLVITAPYHFVRADQLHMIHLIATNGLKVLNLQHLPRGALLYVRTDRPATLQCMIDMESSGLFYGSSPRDGQGAADTIHRAMRLRPESSVAIRVRTQREVYVESQSRDESSIVIPTNPSGVTSHEFGCTNGWYHYVANITLGANASVTLTLPTVDTYPVSGSFPGIDAVRRWNTVFASRHTSIQVVNNGTFAAGFIPPHLGALTTVGNDTTIVAYNNSSSAVTAVVRVEKLLPILTQA